MIEGKILVINTGSTSTKLAYFDSGQMVFIQNLAYSREELSEFNSVMAQLSLRKKSIMEFLLTKSVKLENIDIIMARGGLLENVTSGIYEINQTMVDALAHSRGGKHPCNLSAIIADDLCSQINALRLVSSENDTHDNPCRAFIADAPTADEMSEVTKMLGLPQIKRKSAYHALNSRAMVRRWAKENNRSVSDINIIVTHLGGGSSISLYSKGKVIDVSDSVTGESPMSTDRVGSLPTTPLIELCFSGKYTKEEINELLFHKGGAVAYFGTNDFKELLSRTSEPEVEQFMDAYCLTIAKYIASLSATVCGDIQALIITGGIAMSNYIVEKISKRVSFIAPVIAYPGENEIEALAENGYGVLSGDLVNFPIKRM